MFKEVLIKWVKEITDNFVDKGVNGYLVIGIDSFNSTLYSYVKSIMTSVILPVAYVILALFFVLELYKASLKVDGAGGGNSFGAEIVFKVMFRMVLYKVAVDSCLLFMEAIYSLGQHLINGISNVIANGSFSYSSNSEELIEAINNMNIGQQIGMLLELFIIKHLIFFVFILVDLICFGRMLEIYIYVAISPIPIATFPSDELSQIGKNFLKSFAAICLQGVFIYLFLSFYTVIINLNILGKTNLLGLIMYSLVLGIGVFSSGKIAKSICNAA